MSLSKGFIQELVHGNFSDDVPKNSVQIVQIEKEGKDVVLILSDGEYFTKFIDKGNNTKRQNLGVRDIVEIKNFQDGRKTEGINKMFLFEVIKLRSHNENIGMPQNIMESGDYREKNYDYQPNQNFGGGSNYGNQQNYMNQNNNFGKQQNNNYGNQQNYGSESNISEDNVMPIQALDAGIQNFVVKVRLLEKGNIKHYGQNSDKPGKLLPIEIGDKYGSSIRAVLFNEAIDNFDHMLKSGNCYLMGGGSVKFANAKFSSHPNPLEMSFGTKMECQQIQDDNSIPSQKYNFVSFGDFEGIVSRNETNKFINIIGYVSKIEESRMINTKKGTQIARRNVHVSNVSNKEAVEVQATLWGEKATNIAFKEGDILLFKNIRLSKFGGVSISTTFQTVLKINPSDCPNETNTLKSFFGQNKGSTSAKSLTSSFGGEPTAYNTLSDIQGLDVYNNQSQSVFVRAEILFISYPKTQGNQSTQDGEFKKQRDPWYMACQNIVRTNSQYNPTRKCNKKVSPRGSNGNQFFCEGCAADVTQTCKRRYILKLKIGDHTDSKWITAFDDSANVILGVSAEELNQLKLTNFQQYLKVFDDALHSEFLLKIDCKQKQSQDQMSGDDQLDCRITKAFKIDYSKQISKSLKFIKMYEKK